MASMDVFIYVLLGAFTLFVLYIFLGGLFSGKSKTNPQKRNK